MAAQPRTAAQAAQDVIVFKALANPIRLQIVSLVAAAAEGQVSAGQIVEQFALSQPTISHHLKVLREAGVLTTHRSSTFIYYRFAPTLRDTVSSVLPEQAAAAPPTPERMPARPAVRRSAGTTRPSATKAAETRATKTAATKTAATKKSSTKTPAASKAIRFPAEDASEKAGKKHKSDKKSKKSKKSKKK